MTQTFNNEKANNEMNWVINVLNSVETKEQLNSALNCFFLWGTKFKTKKESLVKKTLESKFWAYYRNKENQFFLTESVNK